MTVTALAGITSGVITLVGLLIYARSVPSGKTKPVIATWFIWTLNSVLLLASYYASGAGDTTWFEAGYTAGLFIIWLLALRFGTTGWSSLDKLCLVGALSAALLWLVTGSSVVAYLMTLLIDLLGIIPTMYHAWRNPSEEHKISWVILLIGALVSFFSLEGWNPLIAWYPFQITLTTAVIVWLLFTGRKHT